MTTTKRRSLIVLAVGVAMLVAGCVPPGSPGTGQRNEFLEVNADRYAAALDATVRPSANPDGPHDYSRCANIVNPNLPGWLSGATLLQGDNVTICYTLTLPTHDATRGSVYMHEVGHAYGYRLTQRGHSMPGLPGRLTEEFADCFSRHHGGNSPCSEVLLKRFATLEGDYPPNDSNGWWTP